MPPRSHTSALTFVAGLVVTLGGCAALAPPPTVHYRCDDERTFSLRVAPDGKTARIDINRMHFDLAATPQSGPGDTPGDTFSCSMLTVRRSGGIASVDLEDAPQYTGCRVGPSAVR